MHGFGIQISDTACSAPVQSRTAMYYPMCFTVDSSEEWWIGGLKISDCWYWRRIVTGAVPLVNTANSYWHSGNKTSSVFTLINASEIDSM